MQKTEYRLYFYTSIPWLVLLLKYFVSVIVELDIVSIVCSLTNEYQQLLLCMICMIPNPFT